jgi:hypothetical protein
VNILFIVDLLEFLQERIASFTNHRDGSYLIHRMDAPCGRLALALLCTIEYHNFKLITNN